jgi:hypothetical protein
MDTPTMFKTDADLLTRSNDWLKTQLKIATSERDRVDREIALLNLILKIKNEIYKRGMVAIQKFERDENGEIEDIAIDIIKAQDALRELAKNGDDFNAKEYMMGQMVGWENDGVAVS